MDARNRNLSEWFQLVDSGTLRLPRFQRFEAWDRSSVSMAVSTVISGLPIGAALILNVGDAEKFVSRPLASAPDTEARVTEHLLDGQQRLTALWRAFHGTYPYEDYFFVIGSESDGIDGNEVVRFERFMRRGSRYPLWCDQPTEVLARGFVPLPLLAPGNTDKANRWVREACPDDLQRAWELSGELSQLREKIAAFNLPYLALPTTTPKHVALDVFVKMNTNSVRLTMFDIVVAQLEEAAGASLHDLVETLTAAVPEVTFYTDPGQMVLNVQCLRERRQPGQQSYLALDLTRISPEWNELAASIKFATDVLAAERVYDRDRLPTQAVLPVVAALFKDLPSEPDDLGNARALIRYYLWRAFLTNRYESSASSRALADYLALSEALVRRLPLAEVSAPIFDETIYPLPTEGQLMRSGWPKKRFTLARGILALSLVGGGRDIADDESVSRASVLTREYHHIFPDSLLTEAGVDSDDSFTALNCLLITWRTNRKISNKSPLHYLEQRVANAHLGEQEVRDRLASHLVPWTELAAAGPYEDARSEIIDDFLRFREARAVLVAAEARARAGAGRVGASATSRTTS